MTEPKKPEQARKPKQTKEEDAIKPNELGPEELDKVAGGMKTLDCPRDCTELTVITPGANKLLVIDTR